MCETDVPGEEAGTPSAVLAAPAAAGEAPPAARPGLLRGGRPVREGADLRDTGAGRRRLVSVTGTRRPGGILGATSGEAAMDGGEIKEIPRPVDGRTDDLPLVPTR
ncbi:hypothetical protein [Streptomyces spiralis]|uniref:hypothetical protein n=1 Tax=Streptomyces spiralis TaxID=66376 RepID=UPI003696B2B4